MNQVAATQLIAQTFDSNFDEQTFESFVANLLNQVDRSKSFGYRSGNIIPQAFRDHISTYRRPFVYYDPNGERLDVLLVRLSKISGLERARTMQRNFAAWYLKQEHDEVPEAALIAFYHEGVSDWRFSFVRLEYAFGEDGAEEKLTPARRYSYLVGPAEPTHTAESQLRPFLIEDATNPTIADLAAAFQIETVSKQFFEEYKELFLKLVEGIEAVLKKDKLLAADFKRAEIHVPNFAKKLLGQIVFLYFVQKKGWLGVAPGAQWGSGSKDFLRRMFAKEQGVTYSNFFNDLLEPLFYEALAVKREGDQFAIGDYTCQIPFLNGGLFEPMGGYDWQHTRLLLPNNLFSKRKNEDDDSGTGVLDVFDRYNFTVWEEEPLEKEVAVDPEMLGKVFENLLEVQDRKSKGAFYTPREIVHYMCQESLINYLDTSVNLMESGLAEEKPVQTSMFGSAKPQQKAIKAMTRVERVPLEDITVLVRQGALALQQDAAKEAGLKSGDYVLPQTVRDHARELDTALATIKLCDPAIGSGAFPVGMLHEIVQARQALGTYLGKPNRPPYPLKWHAIQESIYGVDIDAGAVEIAKLRLWLSLVVDEENYDDIQPLPNLDYKVVCGDSLLGVEKNLFNNHLFVKLGELKKKYFKETHRQEKLKLKAQIEQMIELLTGGINTFDFEVYFHEVFATDQKGFDVVIGNPPYVGEKGNKETFSLIRSREFGKRYYQAKMDLFYFFFHLGLDLLSLDGVVTYITTNYFITATGAKKLRQDIKRRSNVLNMLNLNELKIFASALGQHNMITMLRKTECQSKQKAFNLVCKRNGIADSDTLTKVLNRVDTETEYFEIEQQEMFDREGYIRLGKRQIDLILERMLKKSVKLGDVLNVNAGADVTISKITKKHLSTFSGDYDLNDGVFVLTLDELERMNFSNDERRYVKDFIKNSDIQRFMVKRPKLKLLYLRWEDSLRGLPNIRTHLAKYKDILDDQVKRFGEDYPWYALHRPREQSIFESPEKILVPYRSKSNVFGYCETPVYSSRDVFFITKNQRNHNLDLKFVLALLNSKLFFNWFYYRGKRKGEVLELYATPLKQVPLPVIDAQQSHLVDEIIHIVNTVLDNLNKNPRDQLHHSKKRIDELVYQLYGLDPTDIALIEDIVPD
ncbi:MAG: Eco57I restriction-modification methylase domain-containing protein [Anaerolineales bacterium]|nr:Eco57I restriction-modification methylase domain-containing protein [Anaerolineales bacterium]